ncbi:uncharacterized protein LOC106882475 isoform X3 [Octopus bimaculoides]|uniref:uncharacterized protein LOC106882475 isoform X3 n=1 Tax=Octopus bimaculoides TaxID=37653 RepID=UPI0022E27F54|nr:uncharacterized protein LOC106882475 isoform X3 [Octopus bimaculoides]
MAEDYPELAANLRLENQRLDGPGLESDDEFGEFGGFQAAEPVPPHEPQGIAAGPNAGNLPWMMFPPDLQQRPVHSQPDLLCAQNTFPRHLDSPPSVHDRMAPDSVVTGAAVVSQFDANLLPDIGQNLNHGMQPNMMNGMFNAPPSVADHQARRCDLSNSVAGVDLVSPAGPSWRRPSYGHEGLSMADVPDLNQPASWRHGNASASPRCPSFDEVLNGPQHYVPDQRMQQPLPQPPHPPAPLPQQEQQQQHHQSLPPHHHPHHQRAHPPSQQQQQQQQQQQPPPSVIEDLGGATGGLPVVPKQERRRDHSDGQRDSYLLKQLDELRSRNIELTSRVDSLQVQLSEQKSKYESLQAKHASDLEAIRQAGHDALAVVVEEYKSLCRTAVLQQQEVAESHLKEKLKSEADQYTQMLQEQDEFEKYFHQEQNRYQESLQKVMSEEQTLHQRALDEALHQQQLESQKKFKEEMTMMKYEMKSMQNKYLEEREKALQEEKESREKLLNDLVQNERRKLSQIRAEVVSDCKTEMKNYMAEQRQLDNQLRQQHYVALDLFLESARQQLKLLMDNGSRTENAAHTGPVSRAGCTTSPFSSSSLSLPPPSSSSSSSSSQSSSTTGAAAATPLSTSSTVATATLTTTSSSSSSTSSQQTKSNNDCS